MQLLNKEMRYNSCHKCVKSRSVYRKSIFNQIVRFSLLIYQMSILVILFLNLFSNHKVEGSLSTSKSQLKHERNGKCKYQITLTVRKINGLSLNSIHSQPHYSYHETFQLSLIGLNFAMMFVTQKITILSIMSMMKMEFVIHQRNVAVVEDFIKQTVRLVMELVVFVRLLVVLNFLFSNRSFNVYKMSAKIDNKGLIIFIQFEHPVMARVMKRWLTFRILAFHSKII